MSARNSHTGYAVPQATQFAVLLTAPILAAQVSLLGPSNPACGVLNYLIRVLFAIHSDGDMPRVPLFTGGEVLPDEEDVAASIAYLRSTGSVLAQMDVDDRIGIAVFYCAEVLDCLASGEALPMTPRVLVSSMGTRFSLSVRG